MPLESKRLLRQLGFCMSRPRTNAEAVRMFAIVYSTWIVSYKSLIMRFLLLLMNEGGFVLLFLLKNVVNCGELRTFVRQKRYIGSNMRFIGTIEAKVDQKGRVFLPAQFRRILQAGNEERLILRKDLYEDCLVIYPETVWNHRLDELHARLSVWNKKEQQLFRQFVKDVEWLSLDGNGRFLIPKRYLKMAAIIQSVVFIGMDETIEIWAKEKNDSEAENVNLETEMERIMMSGI